MKSLLIFHLMLLATTSLSWAHLPAPLAWYLSSADKVYVGKVTAVSGNKITFEITDTLLGNRVPELQLTRYPDSENYTVSSKWLLVSHPTGFPGCVGWAMKGDCEWIPATLHVSEGKVYAQDWTSKIQGSQSSLLENLDTASDGSKGLSVDHVRQLLKGTAK